MLKGITGPILLVLTIGILIILIQDVAIGTQKRVTALEKSDKQIIRIIKNTVVARENRFCRNLNKKRAAAIKSGNVTELTELYLKYGIDDCR